VVLASEGLGAEALTSEALSSKGVRDLQILKKIGYLYSSQRVRREFLGF
jgi:hypothetical protein